MNDGKKMYLKVGKKREFFISVERKTKLGKKEQWKKKERESRGKAGSLSGSLYICNKNTILLRKENKAREEGTMGKKKGKGK